MVQALTALHDRHLSPTPNFRQTYAELYHASRAAALFNAKLSSPLKAEDRDPIWATAALLGIAAMCWMEASCVEEAWPLAPRGATDLDWIQMSEKKAAVWEITQPLREGGRFRHLAGEYQRNYEALRAAQVKTGIKELPSGLTNLCEVDEHSTEHNNPYFNALVGLACAMSVESTRANILVLLSFIGHMNPQFQKLLKEKDPRAMLLLAYWYAKIWDTTWWLERRSALECKAICLYLERYHADETRVLELLSVPKMRCGLAN